jgi:ketosteroid isomerase-like protein
VTLRDGGDAFADEVRLAPTLELRRVHVVERWYEALEQDDMPGVIACSSPHIEIRYPGEGLLAYGGTWRGHDGLAGWAVAHDRAEEILVFEIEAAVAQGDQAVVRGRFEGRARDTGQTWETRFAHALTVHDGLVARMEAFFDTAAAVEAHRRERP